MVLIDTSIIREQHVKCERCGVFAPASMVLVLPSPLGEQEAPVALCGPCYWIREREMTHPSQARSDWDMALCLPRTRRGKNILTTVITIAFLALAVRCGGCMSGEAEDEYQRTRDTTYTTHSQKVNYDNE